MRPLVLQNRWEILRKLDDDDDDDDDNDDDDDDVVKFVTSCSGEEVNATKEDQNKENNEEEEKMGNWIHVRRRRRRRIDVFNQLPDDVKSLIFSKLGALEIIMRVQYVCSSWRNLSKDPCFFHVIDARNLRRRHCLLHRLCLFHRRYINARNLDSRCQCMHGYTRWKDQLIRRAVDRSCGQLVEFAIGGSVKDDLIHYVLDNSKSLKRLVLQSCYRLSDYGLIDAVKKVPLLEVIEFLDCKIPYSELVIAQIGRSCLNLKKFALNRKDEFEVRYGYYYDDKEAFVIAENMPKLRHLSLVGNMLTNEGLQAILHGCLDLEYLDVRKCIDMQVNGKLLEQCEQRLIHLTLPDYSLDDLDDYDEVTQWSDPDPPSPDPPSPDPSDDLHDYDSDDYGAWSVTSDGFYDYENNWSYEEDYEDEDILKLLTPKGVKLYI